MAPKKRPYSPNGTAYTTKLGCCIQGKIEDVLKKRSFSQYKSHIDLIFTSPPFPLNRKKKYGNLNEQEFIDWFSSQSVLFSELLSDHGSIVIEMGNSWNRGSPTMSTLALRALLGFLQEGDLHLCQQFIWFNTAKLPTPAPWVTIDRIRVKDAFTNIWWMSKTERPKADNRRILLEYSDKMKGVIKNGKYNSGRRPSNHKISNQGFLTDNGGAIPPNVLISSNTESQSQYLKYCRKNKIHPHPARMPIDIPNFFIKFLTDPNDLVLDPYSGSNTTGHACEDLGRQWISVEPNTDYIRGSIGRFTQQHIKVNKNFERFT
ncbi:MAG: site-specific DNA-methyltransferase [Candidatus Thiodiazotropha endolucinida]